MTRAIGFSKVLVLALLAFLVAASVGVVGFTIAQADDAEDSEITVYFIRHWEKKDSYTIEVLDGEDLVIPEELADLENKVPSSYRELSGLGVEKANRFPDWLTGRGIEPTHLISTHKNRTFFSLRPTSIEFEIPIDLVHAPDCVLPDERIDPVETPNLLGLKEQLGVCASNSRTRVPNLDAIEALGPGDVAVVAQHSGNHWGLFEELLGQPLLEPPFDEQELALLGFRGRPPGDPRDPVVRDNTHVWKLQFSHGVWGLQDIIRVDLLGLTTLEPPKPLKPPKPTK